MARSRFISIAESERSELIYEQVKAKTRIKKVNAMLRALRESGMYDESIAVENMFNYLMSAPEEIKKTKSGYISTVGIKGKSMTQLTGLTKQLTQFISNKTSTPAGMEALYGERRKELAYMIGDDEFVKQLSKKDIKAIYSVFQSEQYDKESRRFDSQTFFTLYTQAIDEKKSKEWFINQMKDYGQMGKDENLRKDISEIYDMFISEYANR